MAFERDQRRQRSYSDPTGLRPGAGIGPGKRTLTQDLVPVAHDEVAQAAAVPLPASRPGTPVAAHDEVEQAAAVPLPPSRTATASSVSSGTSAGTTAEAPRTTWDRRAEYYKSVSYLTASIGTLVSAIGWLLLRQFPSMQPVGQALASDLKNGFGALDDAHKGNQPKAVGQSVSAVGQAVGMAGVIAAAKNPQASQLVGIRAAGAGVNAIGYGFTGSGEKQAGNPAKAGGNFVAAVVTVVGTIGYIVESVHSKAGAFLTLEGVGNVANVATSVGGAIDDGRKSKVDKPWLKDPKVVGQEIAAIGFALSAVATVLSKIYGTHDKEAGTHELDDLAPLIETLGAVGLFLATAGYGVSAYAEAPRKPRNPDVEMQPM